MNQINRVIQIVVIVLVVLVLCNFNTISEFLYTIRIPKVNGQEYNGKIIYNTYEKLDDISYKLPSNFKDKSGEHTIIGSYEAKDENGYLIKCEFTIGIVANYKGTEDLAIGIANYSGTTYHPVIINKIQWYNINDDDYSIYLTTYKNKILMYRYDGTPSCDSYNDEIINTVKIK